MAGVAALADLVLNHVLIPSGGDAWSSAALTRLDSAGSFARNLSSYCLGSFSSRKSGLPFAARAGIASFGWVLVPIITMMTFLPRAMTRVELVLATIGLAHALILLLILGGLHRRSTPAVAIALVLTLVAAFSGFLSMVVTLVGGRRYWEHTDRLSNAFQWSGELAYLAVPLAVAAAIAIPWRETRGKVTLALSALGAGLVAAGMALWKYVVGPDLPDLLYGAVHLEFLAEDKFILYAITLAIGWGVTVGAMRSKDPIRRQLGAALLLLLSAGYAPRTPSGLIVTVLSVALLSRVGIASAQRRRAR